MTTALRSSPLPHDDLGAGPALVLVHAFPFDARMWAPQRAALAATHRVLTPDLAGFGRAGQRPPNSSLDAHADDLAALLDALELRAVTLLGLSMGGYIALAFARRHRERLAGLVLADTRAAPDSTEAKAGRGAAITKVEAEGVAPLVDGLLPKLVAADSSAEVRDLARCIASEQPPGGVIAALGAMRDRPDATELLASLDLPALVIVGEEDAITPKDEAQRISAALLRGSLAVLDGAGHLSNLEAPEAFNTVLLAWLDRNGL